MFYKSASTWLRWSFCYKLHHWGERERGRCRLSTPRVWCWLWTTLLRIGLSAPAATRARINHLASTAIRIRINVIGRVCARNQGFCWSVVSWLSVYHRYKKNMTNHNRTKENPERMQCIFIQMTLVYLPRVTGNKQCCIIETKNPNQESTLEQ